MNECKYLEDNFSIACRWYLSKHQNVIDRIFRLSDSKCKTRCKCACSESSVHTQHYEICAELYFGSNSAFVKNRLISFKCYVPKWMTDKQSSNKLRTYLTDHAEMHISNELQRIDFEAVYTAKSKRAVLQETGMPVPYSVDRACASQGYLLTRQHADNNG